MFNKPAKFEKQLSKGAMSVSNDVNGSPTAEISKSMVEEVQSVNDEENQEVLSDDMKLSAGNCPAAALPEKF
jgi:hypothetical protein